MSFRETAESDNSVKEESWNRTISEDNSMTVYEAINRINEHIRILELSEPRAVEITEALNMAVDSLKINKQRKVNGIKNVSGWIIGDCPSCGKFIHKEYHKSFCGNCGVALDWEDNERS